MTVQAKKQEITTVVSRNRSAFLKNFKYRGFQAPFPERRALLVLGDALLVLLAVWVAFVLWQYTSDQPFNVATIKARISAHWTWFPILLGGWWVLAWLNDLYDIPSSVYKALSTTRVLATCMQGLAIYTVVFFFLAQYRPPRLFIIYFLLVALLTITLWRWTYVTASSLLPIQHWVLIVGGGERARAIARALKQASRVSYHVVGFVDDDPAMRGKLLDGVPMLGRTADLPWLVTHLDIQEIVVATERYVETDLFQLLVDCQGQGARVSSMPDLYDKLNRCIPIQHIDPAWALNVMQKLPSRLSLSCKRLMDLALAGLGLLIFAPCLPLVALAIRLDSRGPVFYRQIRSGRAGRPYTILKFRTMFTDAEKDGQPRWAAEDDPRVTRVGHFLRKTRMDELPQLYNVLRAEMSIVGPRPERPEFIQQLEQDIPFYRTRLMVKPGLTGWAQIHYHYGNSAEDALIKLQYDFHYLQYWSLWLDLYIMFRTFGVAFRFKGT
jgi:exopolysaccharide biosynthesis polyprenyl glycosylphosphotransferase